MKMRWAEFHHSIRIRTSRTRWTLPQILGRMLGINTRRYAVARFFGRPLLRMVRVLRGQNPNVAPRAPAPVVPVVTNFFPLNYRPVDLAPVKDPTQLEHIFNSVEMVATDEMGESPLTLLATLNEILATTTARWLFLYDIGTTKEESVKVVSALLQHALDIHDVIFADEEGPRSGFPILKSPAVGPHTLLSYNLVGRPTLVRVTALRSVGGFSLEGGWAFEHDAYLRLSEAGAQFHHVPLVVATGRPTIAFDPAHVDTDSCRVVQAALDRRGWSGTVTTGSLPGLVRWHLDAPAVLPSIDIIIPTRDRLDLVLRCIESIENQTTYANYDLIILDNDSKEPDTLAYFASTKYRVVPCPGPFNYAHIVNRGVRHSTADFIVTLNNDTILITPDWLERMVALASLPDVGIVGGCLIDQDGRFEHESIVISPYPQHLRSDSNYPHQDHFVFSTRDVAAVTGAVQMVKRDFWNALGGMDEELKVVMNDVDICLRSQLEGRYVVYTPDVKLYHHVSSSRGTLDPLEDRNLFIRRWDIFGSFQDPYFPQSILLLGEQVFFRYRDPKAKGK